MFNIAKSQACLCPTRPQTSRTRKPRSLGNSWNYNSKLTMLSLRELDKIEQSNGWRQMDIFQKQ